MKGIFRDRILDAAGRVKRDHGWRNNRIMPGAARLLAARLRDPVAPSGLAIAFGFGDPEWDVRPPDLAQPDGDDLVDELIRLVPVGDGIGFVDDAGQPVDGPTRHLRLRVQLDPGQAEPITLREFSVLGGPEAGVRGGGWMVNYVAHDGIALFPGDRLDREIVFSFALPRYGQAVMPWMATATDRIDWDALPAHPIMQADARRLPLISGSDTATHFGTRATRDVFDAVGSDHFHLTLGDIAHHDPGPIPADDPVLPEVVEVESLPYIGRALALGYVAHTLADLPAWADPMPLSSLFGQHAASWGRAMGLDGERFEVVQRQVMMCMGQFDWQSMDGRERRWECRGEPIELAPDPQDFVATHDLTPDGWVDSGRNTFDTWGTTTVTVGEIQVQIDVSEGDRRVDVGDYALRIISDFAAPNIWRLRLRPAIPGDARVVDEIRFTGNLGGDTDARHQRLYRAHDGSNIYYHRTYDAGSLPRAPDAAYIFVPHTPSSFGYHQTDRPLAIMNTFEADVLTLTTPQVLLPLTLYVAVGYHASTTFFSAVSQDIAIQEARAAREAQLGHLTGRLPWDEARPLVVRSGVPYDRPGAPAGESDEIWLNEPIARAFTLTIQPGAGGEDQPTTLQVYRGDRLIAADDTPEGWATASSDGAQEAGRYRIIVTRSDGAALEPYQLRVS